MKVKCTKALFLNLSKFILAVVFIYLFIKSIYKFKSNEKGTKFGIEVGDYSLPSLNICPSYNGNVNQSLIINIKDNFTLEDLEQLPSMISILQPELQIYDPNTFNYQ